MRSSLKCLSFFASNIIHNSMENSPKSIDSSPYISQVWKKLFLTLSSLGLGWMMTSDNPTSNKELQNSSC